MSGLARKVDRAGWPSGEWDGEPDRVDFESQGFPCLILRSRMGNLCGYVGVPKGHPWHGRDYDSIEVQVHGGLTYCDENETVIGSPDYVGLWWVGFDCAHFDDVTPEIEAFRKGHHGGTFGTYKNIAYVRRECELLAEEAKAMVRH